MKKAFPEVKQQVLELFNDKHSKEIFDVAERMQRPQTETIPVNDGDQVKDLQVTRMGLGPLDTPKGDIWLFNFHVSDEWQKYSVLVKCSKVNYDTLKPIFLNKEELLIRIDSGCETGQMFLDNTCECREQLHQTMDQIIDHGEGIIVNIPAQDGRGKGLPFKLATLFLQKELKLHTVQSAAFLAGEDDIDVRTYLGVMGIVKYFGIDPAQTKINLATNNPDKMRVFGDNGFDVVNTPVEITPTEHTIEHLAAKKHFLKHQLNGNGADKGPVVH